MKYLFKNRLAENEMLLAEHKLICKPTHNDSRDYHPHYEIYFCNEHRNQSITINGRTITMNTPNVIISAPFAIHSMLHAPGEDDHFERYVLFFSEHITTLFDDSLLSDAFLRKYSNCVFPLSDPDAENLSGLFDRILAPSASLAEKLMLFGTFVATLDRMVPPRERILYGSTDHYIVNILRYIYLHLADDIASESIAREFHISRAKLDRDFRKFVGVSVHQAVVNCRLSSAVDMLANTPLTIREIALHCGFESEYYFYSFFKRNTGKTPTSIRNRKGKEDVKEPVKKA